MAEHDANTLDAYVEDLDADPDYLLLVVQTWSLLRILVFNTVAFTVLFGWPFVLDGFALDMAAWNDIGTSNFALTVTAIAASCKIAFFGLPVPVLVATFLMWRGIVTPLPLAAWGTAVSPFVTAFGAALLYGRLDPGSLSFFSDLVFLLPYAFLDPVTIGFGFAVGLSYRLALLVGTIPRRQQLRRRAEERRAARERQE